MDTTLTIQAGLERRRKAYGFRLKRVERKINFLALFRGIMFLLMILGFSVVFDVAYTVHGAGTFLTATIVFLYLMVVQDRCYRFKERLEKTIVLLENDLARITWRFDQIKDDRPIEFEADHPFAHDLDLTGPVSLLKLLDNTYHDRARDLLKSWIDHADSPENIRARQAAVAELSGHRRFRQKLALAGHLNQVRDLNADMLRTWLDQPIPATVSLAAYILGRLSALCTTGVLLGTFIFGMPLPWLPVLLVQIALFYTLDRIHGRFNQAFMRNGKAITATCAVLRTLEQTPLKAEISARTKKALLVNGNKAGKSLKQLMDLHELLSYRSNGFAHFFLNVLFMWDQHCLFKLAGWRRRYGDHMTRWVDAIFEMEALCALANYHELFPGPFPQLVEGDDIFIEAQNMAHPCIDVRIRVGNDYTMTEAGRLHLITGSNMSGKSTFLRTVGTNLVLARLGAPVCAESLTCSLPKLWTSIRIQDSLAQGVSYFYAEVRRIKAILDEIEQDNRPVFYLMDEILKGTNSRERLIATKAMVHYLLDHRASGLITTHDLELLAIAQDRPDAVTNYHFQERVEHDEMFFDYTLKEGRLTSTNALRVMKFAGVPLTFDE